MEESANKGNLRILAIDDDPTVLRTLSAILRNTYQVSVVKSGTDALRFLQKNPVELVISDFYIPEMNGLEIMHRVTSMGLQIPFVFLTSSDDDDIQVESLEKGAEDFIQKPIKPQVVLSRLKTLFELFAYRKSLELRVEAQKKTLQAATAELKEVENLTFSLLTDVIYIRDYNTGNQARRTNYCIELMLSEMGNAKKPGYEIADEEKDYLLKAAPLRDIGKLAISDVILAKAGALTEYEFDIIRKHTTLGAEMIVNSIKGKKLSKFLQMAYDIVYSHHEKWDGEGYPRRLKGDNIPLSARIAAIIDAYDALTSLRPYRQARDHKYAVQIIQEGSGINYDPFLVEIFSNIENQIFHIYYENEDNF